ncbi:MAG: M28 family peptidase [Chitinophagaceae bacterium]
MRSIILPLLLGACTFASAQKKSNPATFAGSITADDMQKHLYTIASKEMEGRDTPSPGLEKAASYIENKFRSLGLTPGNGESYRQYYPIYRDSMTSTYLKVNGKSFDLSIDFQPNININHTFAYRFSEVVFAGYGIVDSTTDVYKDLDVKGKLVLLLEGAPAGYKAGTGMNSPANSFSKINRAREHGAAAVMFVFANYPRKTLAGAAGNTTIHGYAESVYPQTFTVSQNVAASIMGSDGKNVLETMKTSPLSAKIYKADIDLGYFTRTIIDSASNVIAVMEGTDKKDEYLLLTSHYDHVGKRADGAIFYGADDDGSGTTGILELAEAFSKAKAAGKGPRRTIVFMTVSGEEKGLWGSEYYANHPLFPLEKTSADLNIDMIGRIGVDFQKDKDSSNYVYIIGDDKLSTDLTPITETVNKKYMKMNLDRKYNDPKDQNRFYYRSDHYNFAEKGVPVIFYFNGVHADYHQVTDTPDKINYKLMAKRGQLVFYTAWEIANRDQMLKRDLKLEKP